jgi:hypothetical protein
VISFNKKLFNYHSKSNSFFTQYSLKLKTNKKFSTMFLSRLFWKLFQNSKLMDMISIFLKITLWLALLNKGFLFFNENFVIYFNLILFKIFHSLFQFLQIWLIKYSSLQSFCLWENSYFRWFKAENRNTIIKDHQRKNECWFKVYFFA